MLYVIRIKKTHPATAWRPSQMGTVVAKRIK